MPKIGDILHASWGFNMTWNDFVKVVEVSPTGKTVKVRAIESKAVAGDPYNSGGQVAPARSKMVGKRFKLSVRTGTDGTYYLRGTYERVTGSKRLGSFFLHKEGRTYWETHWD